MCDEYLYKNKANKTSEQTIVGKISLASGSVESGGIPTVCYSRQN